MEEENIKEAFKKVKEDIEFLQKEIIQLNQGLIETREKMIEMCDIMKRDSLNNSKREKTEEKKDEKDSKVKDIDYLINRLYELINNTNNKTNISTDKDLNSTVSTDNSTDRQSFSPPNTKNLAFSTGNRGVPTDRQTNQQTDQQTQNPLKNSSETFDNATKILDSLDSIKKELRLKFKRLTEQELLVFSTIYQLDEKEGYSDYKTISKKLSLTESSIRDYVGRLINKGIPINKTKINNKSIQISIPPKLKKIASLSTILQLREI